MRQYISSIDDLLNESESLTAVAVSDFTESLRNQLNNRFGGDLVETRGYNCWVYERAKRPMQLSMFEDSDPMTELLEWLSSRRLRFMANPPGGEKIYSALVIAGDSRLPCRTSLAKDLNDTPQLDGMKHDQVGCEAAAMKSAKRLYRVTVDVRQVGYRMDDAGLETFTKNVMGLYLNRVRQGVKATHRFAHFEVKRISV